MNVKETIYKMLQENTGKALCDSGGAYGRNWERNQRKTLKAFENDPAVTWEGDADYTISVFHYLCNGLELDDLCNIFNRKKVLNWDSEDFYGVSKEGENWIKNKGFTIGRTFNSYNGESSLSQVIQGTWLELEGEHYLLLQIHQGCDVRGGYTNAKLFYVPKYEDGALSEDVYGTWTKSNGKEVFIDNGYNGYCLTDEEDNKEIDPKEGDIVKLFLSEV